MTCLKKIVQHYQQHGQIIDLPPMSVILLSASVLISFEVSDVLFGSHENWDREKELELVQFIMRGPGS